MAAAGDLLVRILIESNCPIKNFFNHTYATKRLTALQLVDAAAQVLLNTCCPHVILSLQVSLTSSLL